MADEDIKQGEFVIEYVGEGAYLYFYCYITMPSFLNCADFFRCP